MPAENRRNSAVRSAILVASLDLVGEVGYARTTVEAIAARAGVGKQTIYRWWPSKGAVLLDAVLERGFGDAREPLPLPDTGDLRADLLTVMRATVEEFADAGFSRPLRALTIAVLSDEALAEEYVTRLEAPTRRAKLARFASAVDAGQMRGDVPLDLAVDLVFAPIAQRWLIGRDHLGAEDVDAHVDAVLRAIAPPTGSGVSSAPLAPGAEES